VFGVTGETFFDIQLSAVSSGTIFGNPDTRVWEYGSEAWILMMQWNWYTHRMMWLL